MFELKSVESRKPVHEAGSSQEKGSRVRLPPRAIEAEQNVLSILLTNPELLPKIRDRVVAEDFFDGRHKLIVSAAFALSDQNQPVDYATIQNELRKEQKLDAAGGVTYVTQLLVDFMPTASLDYWVDEVLDVSQKRALIKISQAQMEAAYDAESDATTLLAQSSTQLQEVLSRRSAGTPTSLIDLANKVIDHCYELKARTGLPGVPTGFENLDDMTGGLCDGELIVVAARSSMGKSAFMCSMILKSLFFAGVGVAVFSAETQKEKIAQRLIAQHTRIEQKKLRFATIDRQETEVIYHEFDAFSAANCEIFDTTDVINTPAKIKAKVMRMILNGKKPSVIYIDHLHELDSDREYSDERQKLEQIVKDIRDTIARPLKIPVVLLAQIGRGTEARQDKRPTKADLQGCGGIEQAADLIWMIYRHEYYYPDADKRAAEVIISKSRDGETGTAYFNFSPETGRWDALERSYRPIEEERPPAPRKRNSRYGSTPAAHNTKEN